MNYPLLQLACRHHIEELHIKHTAAAVGRPTKGPDDPLFKRLHEKWNLIQDMGIDNENFAKFDSQNSNEVARKGAEATLQYLSQCLLDGVFPREDYKELCELVVLWLGGHLAQFKLQSPGPIHHAR